MLETFIDLIMDTIHLFGGWRIWLRWQEHKFRHRNEQLRAKFIQDGCDVMSSNDWYAWFDTLSVREFMHVALLDEPEKTDIEIAVDEALGHDDV